MLKLRDQDEKTAHRWGKTIKTISSETRLISRTCKALIELNTEKTSSPSKLGKRESWNFLNKEIIKAIIYI